MLIACFPEGKICGTFSPDTQLRVTHEISVRVKARTAKSAYMGEQSKFERMFSFVCFMVFCLEYNGISFTFNSAKYFVLAVFIFACGDWR